MNKYMVLADKAIRQVTPGTDVDTLLEKIANESNLNTHERQRLVEEFNVGMFLKKLSDGTQYEEYQVANPVEVPVVKTSGDGVELKKVASENFDYSKVITSDMFIIDVNDDVLLSNDEPMLSKVASADVDNDIYNIEEKEAAAEKERAAMMDEYKSGLEKVARDNSKLEKIARLTRIASENEGIMKTAISTLSKLGMDDVAIDILENSKYSRFDLASSTAEALPSEALSIISDLRE